MNNITDMPSGSWLHTLSKGLSRYQVITFTLDDPLAAVWLPKVEQFRNEVIEANLPEDKKMIRNYWHDRLVWDDQMAISILIEDDNICGFSTALYRDIFYNSFRIINRMYLHPRIRAQSPARVKARNKPVLPEFPHAYNRDVAITPIMADDQIEVIKASNMFPDGTYVFISKNTFMTRWCTRLTNQLNDVDKYKWQFENDTLHPLLDNREEESGWQHLIYACVTDEPNTEFKLLKEGMLFDDYKTKFKS